MTAPTFLDELAVLGPAATPGPVSLAAAEAYCRRLARAHYENFSVASWLLPRPLRQPFYNLYAYCRWADDLADEPADPAQRLDLLDWWEAQLELCYAGQATHPVFVALRSTIEGHSLPVEPLRDLLVAFRRDQSQTRYDTYADLLDYCRYSANPVGRLVLHLGNSFSADSATLSDAICTGLQLANHWQDVARDFQNGRVYLPREDCRRFGVTEAMLAETTASAFVRDLLRFEVERAEQQLLAGQSLIERVQPQLRLQVHLFLHGGLATLAAIRRQNYDVLARRPTVGKWRKARLLIAACWQRPWPGKDAGGPR